ncbi:hypothetical protein ASC83_11200 [Acidovorax sp. Root402]|nr:hypothetical protein ASC83_11200 [Acidovorax sp. Root402]
MERLGMFGTRLGSALSSPRSAGRLFTGLNLGTAILLLRALVCVLVPLCLGNIRIGGWLANLRVSAFARWRYGHLLVFNGPQALHRFLPALGIVEFNFLRTQSVLGLPCLGTYAAQAILHGKALVAHRLILLPPGRQCLALHFDSVTLRFAMCSGRRGCGIYFYPRRGPGRGDQHRQY